MGMVLEHQLTACYAAGSLGGTLGRLSDSLRRLSRAHCTGSREKPGGVDQDRFAEPPRLACLNQFQRLMSDAWQGRITARPQIDRIENQLDRLKETALDQIVHGRPVSRRRWEYQLLAQALVNLKAVEQDLM